jgi:hypothetical protein
MGFAGHVARTGKMRTVYMILVGKPEGKTKVGGARRRWEDNIKMDVRDIGWKVVDRIHLAEVRDQRWAVLNTVMKLRVP